MTVIWDIWTIPELYDNFIYHHLLLISINCVMVPMLLRNEFSVNGGFTTQRVSEFTTLRCIKEWRDEEPSPSCER